MAMKRYIERRFVDQRARGVILAVGLSLCVMAMLVGVMLG